MTTTEEVYMEIKKRVKESNSIFTVKEIAERINIPRDEVLRAFKQLKKTNKITEAVKFGHWKLT